MTNVEDLEKFKTQATGILEDGTFTIHKWESNVEKLESEDMGNPSKIPGTYGTKEKTLCKFL